MSPSSSLQIGCPGGLQSLRRKKSFYGLPNSTSTQADLPSSIAKNIGGSSSPLRQRTGKLRKSQKPSSRHFNHNFEEMALSGAAKAAQYRAKRNFGFWKEADNATKDSERADCASSRRRFTFPKLSLRLFRKLPVKRSRQMRVSIISAPSNFLHLEGWNERFSQVAPVSRNTPSGDQMLVAAIQVSQPAEKKKGGGNWTGSRSARLVSAQALSSHPPDMAKFTVMVTDPTGQVTLPIESTQQQRHEEASFNDIWRMSFEAQHSRFVRECKRLRKQVVYMKSQELNQRLETDKQRLRADQAEYKLVEVLDGARKEDHTFLSLQDDLKQAEHEISMLNNRAKRAEHELVVLQDQTREAQVISAQLQQKNLDLIRRLDARTSEIRNLRINPAIGCSCLSQSQIRSGMNDTRRHGMHFAGQPLQNPEPSSLSSSTSGSQILRRCSVEPSILESSSDSNPKNPSRSVHPSLRHPKNLENSELSGLVPAPLRMSKVLKVNLPLILPSGAISTSLSSQIRNCDVSAPRPISMILKTMVDPQLPKATQREYSRSRAAPSNLPEPKHSPSRY